MLRLTLISLALLVCASNASLFNKILGSEKEVVVITGDEKIQQDAQQPSEETAVALINNDTPVAAMDDLNSEGQSNGVVIRAKRYYGCGCCCGTCATMAAGATVAACGCGCCGCYG